MAHVSISWAFLSRMEKDGSTTPMLEDREEKQKDKLQQAQGKPQEPEIDNKNWIVVSKWDSNNPGEIQKWNSPLRVFR